MVIEILPIKISKDIEKNDNLADLILNSISSQELLDGDVLVVAQKIISKQEGQIVNLQTISPSILAIGIAAEYNKDARIVETIISNNCNRRVKGFPHH